MTFYEIVNIGWFGQFAINFSFFDPSTIYRSYPSTICRNYGAGGITLFVAFGRKKKSKVKFSLDRIYRIYRIENL